eukprot:Tbor_TRINITY_DN4841_c0_g1::TRINITY_DN4841_c0_g1_i1::g.1426::m.1426
MPQSIAGQRPYSPMACLDDTISNEISRIRSFYGFSPFHSRVPRVVSDADRLISSVFGTVAATQSTPPATVKNVCSSADGRQRGGNMYSFPTSPNCVSSTDDDIGVEESEYEACTSTEGICGVTRGKRQRDSNDTYTPFPPDDILKPIIRYPAVGTGCAAYSHRGALRDFDIAVTSVGTSNSHGDGSVKKGILYKEETSVMKTLQLQAPNMKSVSSIHKLALELAQYNRVCESTGTSPYG